MKWKSPPLRALFIAVSAFLLVGSAAGIGYASFAYAVSHEIDTPLVRRLADWVHLPAAKVLTRTVLYTEYLHHLDALKVFLAGPAARAQGLPETPSKELKSQTYDRVIRIAMVEELAKQRGLVVTPLDVDRAYDDLVARAGTSTTPGEVKAFLNDEFGWSEDDFKQNVIRPAMLEDGLRQKAAKDSGDLQAFDKELDNRLNTDVKRYLKF